MKQQASKTRHVPHAVRSVARSVASWANNSDTQPLTQPSNGPLALMHRSKTRLRFVASSTPMPLLRVMPNHSARLTVLFMRVPSSDAIGNKHAHAAFGGGTSGVALALCRLPAASATEATIYSVLSEQCSPAVMSAEAPTSPVATSRSHRQPLVATSRMASDKGE